MKHSALRIENILGNIIEALRRKKPANFFPQILEHLAKGCEKTKDP